MTLLDAYLSYLEHNKGRAVNTIVSYEGYLKRLKVHLEDRERSLETADRALLEEFIGPVAHQAGITLASRRPLIAAVRNFYKWAEEQRHFEVSPAKYITYPKVGKPLPMPISKGNAEKMLLACDLSTLVGWRDAALLAVLIGSGMRLSGLASLTSSSLSFEPVEEGGQPVLFIRVTEKGRKERSIPMPEQAAWFLLQYLSHPEMAAALPVLRLPDSSHVLWIRTNRGIVPEHEWHGAKRRLTANGIARVIKRRGVEAGIPASQCHAHAFRHLYGTELAEHDVDPQRIQILMGHSSAESSNIYKHLANRKLVETVRLANPLVGMQTPVHAMHQKTARKPKQLK